MTYREFVVIDASGKEVSWVDPVVSVKETPKYWIVKNGARSMFSPYKEFQYRFWKYPGWKYVVRDKAGL